MRLVWLVSKVCGANWKERAFSMQSRCIILRRFWRGIWAGIDIICLISIEFWIECVVLNFCRLFSWVLLYLTRKKVYFVYFISCFLRIIRPIRPTRNRSKICHTFPYLWGKFYQILYISALYHFTDICCISIKNKNYNFLSEYFLSQR